MSPAQLPPRLESLAFNQPAIGEPETKSAFKAVDNDPDTAWRPGKGVTSGTLTVDLQTPKQINTLRVGCPSYSKITGFTLEYLEGETWKTVFTDVNMPMDEYVKTFPAITAQKVRLRITEASGEISIGSFELFEP